MKLSVSAFRAQASAQRKILSSYQNQLNYGACTSFPAVGGFKFEEKLHTMVDSTGINAAGTPKAAEKSICSENPGATPKDAEASNMSATRESPKEAEGADAAANSGKREESLPSDNKIPGRTRSKSNQRWMKLRTTVQLSGAISGTNQKSKPPLKREDSFLKRFSTRQIPETQETVDTGDETETLNGSQTQNEVNRRRRKRRKEMSKTVVNPDENFYFFWLMTVTVCLLYNLWTLIVRQSFPELQEAASAFWYSCDGFTDIVFVCDIVVQFRTGYLEQGLMVYNSRKLATHYLKSRAFILDLLSLLPLDFLQLNIGVNPMLRFPRFLKIYRVYNYYYMVESRTVYPNLWRVVNLIHILLILAHWFGCFYYLLSEAEGFQGDWVYPYRSGDYATLTRKYLGSLYWSTLTLTTIGDLPTPETNAEYLFTIISYLIGVFIFATIVGQVGNVITNRNANRLEFERLLDGAKTYMRHHKVPGGMKRRVLRWYDYSWSRGRIQGGGDINTALGLLPDKLKTELALHVNLSVLKKVTIFQECQPEFLHDLVLKMKAYIFTPGDLICRKGEVAREMFIIADGILDVISDTGRVLTTMKAGDFFGEIGILNLDGLNKRTADVRSVGYSELFSLSREDVLAAMKDYPEAQDILQSLGRKRLMEAKNASKLYKAQVKQAKDHDSSGDSDTAGKRIVEKLRSDVKGLKNVLRRSRRGTRSKETSEKTTDDSGRKTPSKKHSILRRMSHVQSSDEYEANNDIEQTPIGAGLPLLQRLKLLKEKQEKEKGEKEVSKSITRGGNETKRCECVDEEKAALGPPSAEKLKVLKQIETKDSTNLGSAAVSSTVRTQVTGVRFDKSVSKSKMLSSGRGTEKKSIGTTADEDDVERGRTALKERLKMLPSGFQEAEIIPSAKVASEKEPETSVCVSKTKETDHSAPKLLRNKFEVPRSKDAWKILRNSSISRSKTDRKLKAVGNIETRKAPKKSVYLSKSDTVLERQKSREKDEEKFSGSRSSLNDAASSTNLNGSTARRKRVESLSEAEEHAESAYEVTNPGCSRRKQTESASKNKEKIKKYNSISDLSPEYSGLPFVKKLKILNERQKLEELEKELLVRSVSLDDPERPTIKRSTFLVRSQSEASAVEVKNGGGEASRRTRGNERCENEAALVGCDERFVAQAHRHLRLSKDDEKSDRSGVNLEGSVTSPESNETLERRHLKSILKKLSTENTTSDEDKTAKASKRNGAPKRVDAEFRKLIRAPTVEGYAARHKKLTKSVTFDSEALPGPAKALAAAQTSEESQGKSFSPASPTAILTLQLSNLSMIPIAGPKTDETDEEERVQEKTDADGESFKTIASTFRSSEPQQRSEENEFGKEKVFMPYALHDIIEDNFRTLPFIKSLDDNFFNEIKVGISQLFQRLLEEAQTRFNNLQTEVKKKDEIILQLHSKIQELEANNKNEVDEEENKRKTLEGTTSGSETDRDPPRVPFQRSVSFDADGGIRCFSVESPRVSPPESVNVRTEIDGSMVVSQMESFPEGSFSAPGDHLRGFVDHEEEDALETEDKVYLLPPPFRRAFRKSLEPLSAEEIELEEIQGSSDSKKKRREMEFLLIKNSRVDGNESEAPEKCDNFGKEVAKSDDVKKFVESRSKSTTFRNRVSKLQRTFSCSQEKTADFVTLDIDDSSNSSDSEYVHNKDWEVRMLVEEMEENDPDWENEEEKRCSETNVEHLDDVKKLQVEVDALKKMVCGGDLTRLTSSELDILETIIESKDEKLSQLEKSNSLEDNDKSKRLMDVYSSESDYGFTKYEKSKKPSLGQKIGHTLSFDFHDIESEKPKPRDGAKLRAFSLKKQKTISYSPREHQTVYNLWHASSRLRRRVLEDTNRTNKALRKMAVGSPGSSLPTLTRRFRPQESTSGLRTSLPILCSKEFGSNFAERLTSSLNTFEETHQREVFKRSCDSAFEEPEALRRTAPKESQHVASLSTSGTVKQNDCYPGNSLNSFIKSVGQKVKQVMAGDQNTDRNPLPTISKLCDEQLTSKMPSEDYGKVGGMPSERIASDDPPKSSDSFDHDSKNEPPDL